MTEEEKTVEAEAPASEEQSPTPEESQPQEKQERMVPLAAYEAERKKRQEAEHNNKLMQDYLLKQQEAQKKPEEPDEESWVSRKEVKAEKHMTKREILEEVFVDSNPDKMQEVNQYLEKIVERKPWLADSIKNAPNRYARAWEVVQDYKHLVVQQQQKASDAQKIVENAKKPGSPVQVGKSDRKSNSDFLLSIRGTKDFNKYRSELLGRR